jgi:repressor LexA
MSDASSAFPAKLTARQQQILELIQAAIANTGAPPTRAEIAAELGFKSANAAEEHLQALARKGVIELVSGTSRGIRLRSDMLRSVNERRIKQFTLPLQELAQLALPLVGRVAAGSPILAQEHVDQTYYVESSLFQHKPDYLLRVRGMSMRDAGIMDGDLLAVRATKDAKNGHSGTMSPSSATSAPPKASNCIPRTPTTPPSSWSLATPSRSKAWPSG